MMLPRAFTLLVILAFGPPLSAAKNKDRDVTEPNRGAGSAPVVFPPKKGPITVVRGQPVDIELTGTTSSTSHMKFIIRSAPKIGKLEGEPRSTSKTTSVIRYLAPLDSKGETDQFTFAAQVPGSSTSEPATVTVKITDAAPKLDAPPLIEATRVILGHPVSRQFRVANNGNAPWTAKVPAPKGWAWKVPAAGEFRIGPGEEMQCEIECLALALGDLDETAALPGHGGMRFAAKILRPFTLLPPQALLKWKAAEKIRQGSVDLQNLDDRPLAVKVDGPAWLKLPPEISLEAGGRANLTLSASGDPDKSLSGTVKLTSGTFVHSLEVKAEPAPAVLRVTSGTDADGGIQFGKLTAETVKTAKRRLTVKNEGGSACTMTVTAPVYFRLETAVPESGIPLAAGAEAVMVILPPAEVAGSVTADSLTLTAGAEKLSIPLAAQIEAGTAAATPGMAAEKTLVNVERPALARPQREADLKRSMTVDGLYLPDGTEDDKIPRVNAVDIEEDTGDSILIAWDLPEGDGWTFRLFYPKIERLKATGEMAMLWLPCRDDVTYAVSGRRATAKVTGLLIGSAFKFRIQTIAPDGRKSWPGKFIRYIPMPDEPSHWRRYWDYYAAGAVALVLLGRWIRKKWKQPISAV